MEAVGEKIITQNKRKREKSMTTKFTYAIFATPKGKGYACFAINREKGSYEYKVAASFCNPVDKKLFSKKLAKLYAATKVSANDVNTSTVVTSEENDFAQIMTIAINQLTNVPNWAKRAGANGFAYHTLKYDMYSAEQLIKLTTFEKMVQQYNCDDCECESCSCAENAECNQCCGCGEIIDSEAESAELINPLDSN